MTWDWSQINWAAELVKFIGTLGGVSIGAYAAYQFASRGRREDLFLKERYKATENVISLLISLEDTLEKVKHAAIGNVTIKHRGVSATSEEIEKRRLIAEEFYDYRLKLHESRRSNIFISRLLVARLNIIQDDIYGLHTDILGIIAMLGYSASLDDYMLARNNLFKQLDELRVEVRQLNSQIIREQRIPGIRLEEEA